MKYLVSATLPKFIKFSTKKYTSDFESSEGVNKYTWYEH
jgi:hypothetical protein